MSVKFEGSTVLSIDIYWNKNVSFCTLGSLYSTVKKQSSNFIIKTILNIVLAIPLVLLLRTAHSVFIPLHCC